MPTITFYWRANSVNLETMQPSNLSLEEVQQLKESEDLFEVQFWFSVETWIKQT